jgi:hypothetical protein
MKKISKKLSLKSETVRVLAGPELEQAVGGGIAAVGETVKNTIMRIHPSLAAAASRQRERGGRGVSAHGWCPHRPLRVHALNGWERLGAGALR